jgi:uncharacterized protein (TIGR03435 family)
VKRLILSVLALAAFWGNTLFAQDLAGAWQGTLHLGNDLRIILKISKGDNGWGVVSYSIDENAHGLKANAVTVEGATFRFSIAALGGTYEGKLSENGSTIVGTWTLRSQPLPLNFTRANADTAWEIPKPPASMDPNASPGFDVATVKPHDPNGPAVRSFYGAGRQVFATYTTVRELMLFAYSLHVRQVVGGPDWMGKDKFDITGVPDLEGQPDENQIRIMLQKLMADRFKLAFHHDTKELSVYALSLGKNGPKLTRNEEGGGLYRGMRFGQAPGGTTVPVINATLGEFVALLERNVLDRPMIDRTGLAGRFDFQLTWAPDESQFNGHFRASIPSDDPPPDIYTAVREQLGLKMESIKAPVDILVIDHVERPSEN